MRGWLGVREVATETSLSEEQVRRLIRKRELEAVKFRSWFVHPDELQRFIQSRMNTAAPLAAQPQTNGHGNGHAHEDSAVSVSPA